MSFAATVISLGVLFLAMTWGAIFHISARDFGSPQRKAVWGIVVAFVPFVGVLLYVLWGRKQGKRPQVGEMGE